MEAASTDNRTFQLTENGQSLGKLTYKNLLSMKAEIELTNAERYVITPVGFFGTSISITKDGNETATLVMNWRGQLLFTFQREQQLLLKLNGLLSDKYTIETRDGEKLIQLEAKFNWRKFHYNYDITNNMTTDERPQDVLLLLLGVYASNYFIACMSGAGATLV